MTDKINELMKIGMANAFSAKTKAEKEKALRAALEAALKPGEPMAFYDGKKFYGSLEAASMCMADAKKIVPVYTAAPPAQTPSWVDVAAKTRVAQAVYERLRSHIHGLGPWSALDADTVQAIANAVMLPPAQPDAKPGELRNGGGA
jgi:hypothetical protein